MSDNKVIKEMKRWLLNDMESSLHQRINNRGIMGDTHTMILKLKQPPLSRLQKGLRKEIAIEQYRNKNNPQWFRQRSLEFYKSNK